MIMLPRDTTARTRPQASPLLPSASRRHAGAAGVLRIVAVAAALTAGPAVASAQDYFNIMLPAAEVERRLKEEPFRIVDWRGSRAAGDRTSRVSMTFPDDTMIVAKWAIAPPNGAAFNNEPRYEVAAYELQKLFLDEAQYVVPPTLLRAFPVDLVRERAPDVRPTFGEAPGSVVVALQYWLIGVQPDRFWEPRRAAADTVYARHIGNLNVLTYLIRHSDENVGNFLISTSPDNPRVFSVDNGVSFASQPSDRGHAWRDLRVRRLPHATVERLRSITEADLQRALAVLAEYEVHAGVLVPVAPGENMAPSRGVRRSANRIQFGLTAHEIRGVDTRLRQLLRQVDAGRINVF